MTDALDLDAYLDRIDWHGGVARSHDGLAALLGAHMASIPFENLDVLLGRPIRLDLGGLQEKLVRQRRGGYCFEHGMLFAAVLEALGFEIVRHTARVVLNVPRTASPRTHMCLTVRLPQGTAIVDPGFGSLAPRVPVPLQEGVEAHAGTETHWMARDGDHWILRARRAGEVVDCWHSTLEPDNLVDFEVGSHYVATHPASSFRRNLMLRALTADGRVTVMNRELGTWRDGVLRSEQIGDRRALRALLAAHFGFDLPAVESLRVPAIADWS
jgi:N-hydroxyarylamine O-acetyltransferase